jgi:ABC-type amino acid transport substrate-binding protein
MVLLRRLHAAVGAGLKSAPTILLIFNGLMLSAGARAEQNAELRVCLLEDNLPLSSRKENSGFDLDTGKAVAEALQRTFLPVWVANSTQIQEIEESDFPLRRLSKNECDAIFSIPGEDAIKDAPKAALGAPYYGAAFEFVSRGGTGPSGLKTLQDTPVAVQAQTIASFILNARKVKMYTFFSVDAALMGVTKGEAPVAFVWGPLAGWYLRSHPDMKLAFTTGYEPPAVARWNEHVATRQSDTELRAAIDAALGRLVTDGTLKTLAERYGMILRSPFATTYSAAELQKLKQ